MNWTAVYQKVPQGYVAWVEELPGANTQGETLEETKENLKEAITLLLESNRSISRRTTSQSEVLRESIAA
jgi:predicted RNase H-like HicB family nuclease